MEDAEMTTTDTMTTLTSTTNLVLTPEFVASFVPGLSMATQLAIGCPESARQVFPGASFAGDDFIIVYQPVAQMEECVGLCLLSPDCVAVVHRPENAR
jgi:hypothetical protein